MRTATNATSIKTNTQEELVSMVEIRNSIIALVEAWESNRATKVIQMVAIAHDVDQAEVAKVVIELVERDDLELVGNRLSMFECQPVNHLVSEDPMDIIGEYEIFAIACNECNNAEAGEYIDISDEDLPF